MCHIRVRLRERLDRLNTYVELQKALVVKGFEDEVDYEWEDDPWAEEEAIQKEGLLDRSAVLPLPEFLTDDLLSLAAQEQSPALGVLVEHCGTVLSPPTLHNP